MEAVCLLKEEKMKNAGQEKQENKQQQQKKRKITIFLKSLFLNVVWKGPYRSTESSLHALSLHQNSTPIHPKPL